MVKKLKENPERFYEMNGLPLPDALKASGVERKR